MHEAKTDRTEGDIDKSTLGAGDVDSPYGQLDG